MLEIEVMLDRQDIEAIAAAIAPHAWKDGRTVTFGIRVRNLGQRYRIDLGTNHEGWSVERAHVELDDILRQIERGTWTPPIRTEAVPTGPPEDETLHVTASRWWQRRRSELRSRTQNDYRWRLDHVLRELALETTAPLTRGESTHFARRSSAAAFRRRSVRSPSISTTAGEACCRCYVCPEDRG